MKAEEFDFIEQLQQAEREKLLREPPVPRPPFEPPTIHWAELPEAKPGDPHAEEWSFYRREACRLLADGNEGRWALIKGNEIIGIWNTEDEARQVGLKRFLAQGVMMKQILEREPIFRCNRLFYPGFLKACHG